MADRDEHAVDLALGDGAGLYVLELHAAYLERVLGAGDVFEDAVPDHLDLGMLEQPVLQNLFSAKRVAPVHDRDLGGKIGEEQCLFDRGIAAADHDHFLVAIEEAVAGRAGRHAIAFEFLFGGQIEPARLRAGRDDERVGEIDVAGIADQLEGPLRQFHLVHVVGDDAGADMLGLRLHLLHQPGSLDDVGEAGIVLDVGGDRELAAGLHALNQDRLQHGARGIDGGGVAGRSRADDHDFGVGRLCHACFRPPGGRRRAHRRRRRPDVWPALLPCPMYGFRRAMQDTQPVAPTGWPVHAITFSRVRNIVSRNIISRYE